MCCYFLVVIFFFKQKTAYEMRISDWSSDVCSSDLMILTLHNYWSARGCAILQPYDTLAVAAGPVEAEDGPPVMHDQNNPVPEIEQIGRASCRERVCQYV